MSCFIRNVLTHITPGYFLFFSVALFAHFGTARYVFHHKLLVIRSLKFARNSNDSRTKHSYELRPTNSCRGHPRTWLMLKLPFRHVLSFSRWIFHRQKLLFLPSLCVSFFSLFIGTHFFRERREYIISTWQMKYGFADCGISNYTAALGFSTYLFIWGITFDRWKFMLRKL